MTVKVALVNFIRFKHCPQIMAKTDSSNRLQSSKPVEEVTLQRVNPPVRPEEVGEDDEGRAWVQFRLGWLSEVGLSQQVWV
jgi:hypothetical protein